ncbi:MAG: helix-turn-helix transcriptional regulator [Eubacterium sp.]|nr:helix-turn-helix transcriptional regulator [Eubacterium sp.]
MKIAVISSKEAEVLLQNIKKLCKERHLTLTQLERDAGIPSRSLHRWDEVMPAADKLLKVANCLGVDPNLLLKESIDEE